MSRSRGTVPELMPVEAEGDAVEMEPALELRERASASVFGAIGAVLLSLLYWLARGGFDNPVFPIMATLGVALFILCAPVAGWWLAGGKRRSSSLEWWRSQPFLAVVAIAVTALAGLGTRLLGAAPA